jgi:hypothetical protein
MYAIVYIDVAGKLRRENEKGDFRLPEIAFVN